MSNYNQDSQGKQDPKGPESHPQGIGQNPSPKPVQQKELPDQGILSHQMQEQLRKQGVQNEEKGLIHQLPGGESG